MTYLFFESFRMNSPLFLSSDHGMVVWTEVHENHLDCHGGQDKCMIFRLQLKMSSEIILNLWTY